MLLLIVGTAIILYLIFKFKNAPYTKKNPNAKTDLDNFMTDLSGHYSLDYDKLDALKPLFDFIKSNDYPYYQRLYTNSLKTTINKEIRMSDEKSDSTSLSLSDLLKKLNFDIKRVVTYPNKTPSKYFFLDDSKKFLNNTKFTYGVLKNLFREFHVTPSD